MMRRKLTPGYPIRESLHREIQEKHPKKRQLFKKLSLLFLTSTSVIFLKACNQFGYGTYMTGTIAVTFDYTTTYYSTTNHPQTTTTVTYCTLGASKTTTTTTMENGHHTIAAVKQHHD